MNILISRKDLKDTKSGIPRHISGLSEQLIQMKHKVSIISELINAPLFQKADATPVKTFRWPFSGYKRRVFYNWQVELYIKKHKPALVLGNGDIIKQDVLSMHNCAHLAHERIYLSSLPPADEVGRMHSAVLSSGGYKLIVCNSHIMKEDFKNRFGINEEKMEVAQIEIPLDSFDLQKAKLYKKTYPDRYGINNTDIIIGLITSGNFRKRNVDGMIKAFSMINQNGVKLFIAGSDSATPYQKLASKLGIGDKVIFAPAINDVQAYYHMIDFFVLPAHIEEFGLSVAEAMYCKKPVIVSKYTGASEIIKNKEYVIKENTPEEIAGLLQKMLNNKSSWQAYGQENHNIAIDYVAGRFSPKIIDVLINRGLLS